MKAVPERPPWLRVKATGGRGFERTAAILNDLGLATVCSESGCPNRWECWSRREATFLIMGSLCTRTCRYCRVAAGPPQTLDPDEPARIGGAVEQLGLGHVVITSVARDDLPDGGAAIFAATTARIREAAPTCRIELLIPDFQGATAALDAVISSGADIIGHNIEIVPRLFRETRPEADYARSLAVLRRLSGTGITAKTGLLVGLGESRAEVREVLRDVRDAGADSVTIGQYLAPSLDHLPVIRYWRPYEFIGLAVYARRLGFHKVVSGPLVRSSYRAGSHPDHSQANG